MDPSTLIAIASVVFNLGLGLIGYLMRDKMETMTQTLKQAENDIVDIKVNYAHKADVHAMKQEILNRFDRLEDKLTKAS